MANNALVNARVQTPVGKNRSPTAIQDKVDKRDENIYSSIVCADGGAGSQKLFTNPVGQSIPSLKGSSITLASPHTTTYSLTTTNLTKAGELGAGIGDAAVYAMGINIEQAPLLDTGAYAAYGAAPEDVIEIMNKCYFVFSVAAKAQIKGPVWAFPSFGGGMGSISTTDNAVTLGMVSNGGLIGGRKLKIPILVDRSDTLDGEFGVATSDSLEFRTDSGAGAETIVTVLLKAVIAGDVR